MAAYVIAQIEITDPDTFQQYRNEVPATLAAYGGKFLVRGGRSETLEGTWEPKRLVVLEFPDSSSAKAWWSSQAYEGPKALRQRAAHTELIVIDGI